MERVTLQLIQGDVRRVDDISCLLFGGRCPLKREIADKSGQVFVRKTRFGSPFPFEVLEAPGYRWPMVLCVDFRSHNKLNPFQFFNLHLSLQYALRKAPTEGSICIMPLSARNPDYVALGTIYALWSVTHGTLDPHQGTPRRRKSELIYQVVADEGIECYEAVLANKCERMWGFIESVLARKDIFLGPFVPGLIMAPVSDPESYITKLKLRDIRFDVQRRTV